MAMWLTTVSLKLVAFSRTLRLAMLKKRFWYIKTHRNSIEE